MVDYFVDNIDFMVDFSCLAFFLFPVLLFFSIENIKVIFISCSNVEFWHTACK